MKMVLFCCLLFVGCVSEDYGRYIGRQRTDLFRDKGTPSCIASVPAKSSVIVYNSGLVVIADSNNIIVKVVETHLETVPTN